MCELQRLLPADVIVVEATDEMWNASLTPAESMQVRNAVSRRRSEFRAGRSAARVGLQRLGIVEWDLLADEGRRPIWPPGIVGSITHCRDYCAAAVARSSCYISLGIDAEEGEPLPASLIEVICTARERQWIEKAGGDEGLWAKLIFSAKEAFYKTYSPVVGRYLDFLDVEIDIDVARTTFTSRLQVRNAHDAGLHGQRGRFSFESGLVRTATVARVASGVTRRNLASACAEKGIPRV